MNGRPPSLGTLGLRGRTTLVFGLMALALCGLTALAVWSTVSAYLLDQRQGAATAQAVAHAEQLATTVDQVATTPNQQLARLSRGIGSVSLLRLESRVASDRWYTSSLEVSRETLPPTLRQRVEAGQAVRQRLRIDGDPKLVVGVPLPEGGAYFEVFPLVELDETYSILAAVLFAGVVIIPAATIVLSRWALRPALRPLDRVSAVASAVAAGDLSARLDPGGDPALVPIADSFNSTAAALERRVRVDAQFAADVSHELRSPLTAIMGAVSLIAEHRSSLPPEGGEMLNLIEAEVGRFARLVEDLLEISRMEAGSADVALGDVRLADLIRHTVPQSIVELVQVTDPGEEVIVTVDRRRMERVLVNLIENAERHGGGVTAIRVDAVEDVGTVSVEDGGPGLRDDERERIFDRFARSRRSGRDSTAGAGLGLSLVARHLQLMGGTITAENGDGAGARFVVTVPASGGDEVR